jgi:hypothetical protein
VEGESSFPPPPAPSTSGDSGAVSLCPDASGVPAGPFLHLQVRHDRGMENALQGYGHIFKIILQVPSKSFVTAEQYIGL